jgi:hypothetical protein
VIGTPLGRRVIIVRIESGRSAPKWSTIECKARAVGTRPVVRLLEAAE